MVYRHIFYAFTAAPPFAIIAAGEPGYLPRRPGPPAASGAQPEPTVQFASGMAVDEARGALFVAYSELDCGAQLAEFALDDVLAELSLGSAGRRDA